MWNYVQEITKHLIMLLILGLYLAYATSKFEVITISILLLIYVRINNRALLLSAKADYFMHCLTKHLNRIREVIPDPEYDKEGETRGMAKLEEAAKGLMNRSAIDDAIFFALHLIVATKIFVTFI
jgi:hypothetical protein